MLEGKPQKLESPTLPNTPCEVYFDMESDPFSETEYLFGLLVVEDGKERLEYFIAKTPEEERKVFEKFMARMKQLLRDGPELAIYHYHHYEPKHVERLVEKYGGSSLLKDIQDHMVDLLPIIRKSVVDGVSIALKIFSQHLMIL